MIEGCIEALTIMAPEASVIVVDNASQDRTADRVPRSARLLTNTRNNGFAAAANQGIRSSPDADFLLLLNPDVRLLTGLHQLVDASRTYGLAAGKLVDKSGRAQRGFTIRRLPTAAALIFELLGLNRLWRSNPVNRRYRYMDRDLETPGEVEQPAGAFVMFRRDVWERLGGLDERFQPVWFEDVDFCCRARIAGYRIEYVPDVVAEHEGAHSVGQVPAGRRALYWCVSLLRYAAKHFGSLEYRMVCLAVLLTSVPRAVAGIIRDRNLSPVRTCITIVRFAGRYLLSPRNVPGAEG